MSFHPVRVLVTGGAGFVGSSIAIYLAHSRPGGSVVALDNLHRRGSELTLERLRTAGVRFEHGDIRIREDIESVGAFDLMVECSAEPSVHAGYQGDPSYLLGANLSGTINCLEAARRAGAALLFLSTSRVYPIPAMRQLPLVEASTRLLIQPGASGPGWSEAGISVDFPLAGHRSLYGATKLASELLIEEYRSMYGLPAIVDRCGVIAGPWQMGRVDQGFVSLWAARHLWGDRLSYTGFGGRGLQVRDVLHVDDLCELVSDQIQRLPDWSGAVLNVGGGAGGSVSLKELTALCEARAGRRLAFSIVPETAPADIPYYVSDNAQVTVLCGWSPRRSVETLLDDVFAWLRSDEGRLHPILAG
jgi:CDP-paratose 2-epimerase